MTERENCLGDIQKFTIPDISGTGRIDKLLAELSELELSRSRIVKLIEASLVKVDGKIADKKMKVGPGQVVEIEIPAPEPIDIVGEDIPLDIIFEDEHILVVNKPAGMVTHPAAGNWSGTLVNGLIYHFGQLPSTSGDDRPGIVHRLDKNTSGLLAVARTDIALVELQKAITSRSMKRTYLGLICGHMKEEKGSLNFPIGRSIRDRKKMAVTNHNSRDAITDYQLLERYRTYELHEINLQTGRTHQIRVHFSHMNHPVFGDPEYGGRTTWHKGIFAPERDLGKRMLELLDRQALHAQKLEFDHPATGERLKFESDIPDDYQALLDLVREEGS